MRYFVNAEERAASGHKNYIEFQVPTAIVEFWDETSLYMSEDILRQSGFGEFWSSCVYSDIVFDMDTLSRDDLEQMTYKAIKYDETILELISELKEWLDDRCAKVIEVNWAVDRVLTHRRGE